MASGPIAQLSCRVLCESSSSGATATSAGRRHCASRPAATRSRSSTTSPAAAGIEEAGTDSLTPIADLEPRIAAWQEISGKRDPQPRRRGRGRRLPRRGRRRDPPRGGRPLRPAGLGALLDGLAPEGGRDPVRQRDRQPQPALRDPRPRPRVPPGQARDDGRVRPAQHRYRGGLHRDRAQGPQGHAAVPEAAGLALPLLEGPRLDQHPLRLPHLGPARDRPQPGRRLRDRDRGDRERRAPDHPLRLRRDLRHRAQPLLPAGGDRPPADRLRRRRPDPRLPQHPRHARLRRAGGRRTRPSAASSASSTSSPSSSRSWSWPSWSSRPASTSATRSRSSTTRTRGSRRKSTTTTRSTPSCSTSASSRPCWARSWSSR